MNGTKTKVEIECYEVEYGKTVTEHNKKCGAVYLPHNWVGRKVHVILLEEPVKEEHI